MEKELPIAVDSEDLEVNIDGADDETKFQEYLKEQLKVHKQQVESLSNNVVEIQSVSCATHFTLRKGERT